MLRRPRDPDVGDALAAVERGSSHGILALAWNGRLSAVRTTRLRKYGHVVADLFHWHESPELGVEEAGRTATGNSNPGWVEIRREIMEWMQIRGTAAGWQRHEELEERIEYVRRTDRGSVEEAFRHH